MTDPVGGISGTKETSPGGTYSGGSTGDQNKKKKSRLPENDLVEISQDARDISTGKKKRSIVDYLKELLG